MKSQYKIILPTIGAFLALNGAPAMANTDNTEPAPASLECTVRDAFTVMKFGGQEDYSVAAYSGAVSAADINRDTKITQDEFATLAKEARAVAVGTVVDAENKPLEDATVTLLDIYRNPAGSSCQTNEKGAYALAVAELKPGTYIARASYGGKQKDSAFTIRGTPGAYTPAQIQIK